MRCHALPGRYRVDGGSGTVELVVSIPVLLLMLWFLVFCGRMADSRLRIEDVAHQAARAASSARTSSGAEVRARTTAAAGLRDEGITCRSFEIVLKGDVQPGGITTITLTCRVDLDDLALLQVPGSAALNATFSAPVDVYRGTTNATPFGGAGSP
ncbi:TadE family protein [Streptomyces sp. Y7]|uniref:TadE family protein n=1 Tax=Streptomyces sp. Y7 TaxID=3342392 RepID=UPI0037129FF7